MVAVWNTNLAASTGVVGWVLFHYIFKGQKFTVIGACEGAIAGLVGITPAAGYVTVWYAAAIGFITAVVICLFEKVNEWLRIDDGLEVFKLHGIGGMCGAFLTGIFATADISSLDGIPTIVHGAVDGDGVQIARQLAEIASIFIWSFVCSPIMLMILKYIPGMRLRVTSEAEELGMDIDQFDDEMVGEWDLFSDETRRNSLIMHGVPVRASASAAVDAGAQMPNGKEEKLREAEAESG